MKRQCLAVLLALLLLLPVCPALGEDATENASGVPNLQLSVDPTGRDEGFSAILYNNLNGLPTSDANAITETSEGFIWIGSYAGLIRYDGNTFERFDSTTGIASVRALFVDSKDRLWIGTNDSGLFVMTKGELQRWDKAEGMRSSSIRAIAEDRDGTIYVGSTVGMAVIDGQMNMMHLEDDRVNGQTIREIRLGNDGLLYVLTGSGDIFTLENGKVTSFLSQDENSVQGVMSILPDPEKPGMLYIGTDQGAVCHGSMEDRFASADKQDISPLSDAETMEMIDGKIWICAGAGIGNLDGSGFHLVENVPMNNSVGHVMTDYAGNLWFTSTRQGVMKIVPNQFSDYFNRCGLPSEVVNSTCMYEGMLFIGTDNGLILTRDAEKVDALPLTEAATASGLELDADDLIAYLDGVRIRSVIRDSKDRLWISTWRKYGLLRYDHLKGDEIPRVAQIIAVADCFDAMYSNRPYRKRMNFEKAVSIIQEVSGTQLATDVVDAFMRLVAKGEFRDPEDHGGGTTENIDNIHKAQQEESEGKGSPSA